MTKLKLKLLLAKYKYEISNGNNEHLKDLIAVMVLLDLSYAYTGSIEHMNMNNTTLKSLMFWLPPVNSEYEVPTIDKINLLKKKYKKKLKSYSIPLNYITENAATTWIEMMINFGMINEGQIINLEQFVLADFMTDEKLISLFETNGMSIYNHNSSIRR